VVVACVDVPKLERSVVNGHAPLPLGHEVRQSTERQSVVALIAVDDANGNCDAAAVEEAKKTPCVEIEVVVAAVEVAKVEMAVNGYPMEFAMVHVLPVYESAMPEPLENVVVAAPIHAPLRNASVCPAEPVKSVVVEIAVGAALPPVRLASTVFAAWVASCVSASVPLMVESVEVAAAYTFPAASTPRPELEREVSHVVPEFVNAVVDAFAKCEVEDALSPFLAQRIEVVAAFTVAKFSSHAKGFAVPARRIIRLAAEHSVGPCEDVVAGAA
jgi:hypothetical protein